MTRTCRWGKFACGPKAAAAAITGWSPSKRQLGTRGYPRLRLGIGRRADDDREITDYVLGRFAAAERQVMEEVLDRAGQQVECWLSDGIAESDE